MPERLGHVVRYVRLAALKQPVRRLVGQAGVGVDDRFHQPVVDHTAVLDVHEQAQRQTIHVRHQRAKAVGQAFGQHGHGQAGQVQRCAPLIGVAVNGVARAHIVADVSDVHAQPPALFRALDGHRVVEILRRSAVDGEGQQSAQILAADGVLRPNRVGHVFRRLCHCAGGFGGKALIFRYGAQQRGETLLLTQ